MQLSCIVQSKMAFGPRGLSSHATLQRAEDRVTMGAKVSKRDEVVLTPAGLLGLGMYAMCVR